MSLAIEHSDRAGNLVEDRRQHCLAFAQGTLGKPGGDHIRGLPRVDIGQAQLVLGRAVRLAKMRRQHAERLARASVEQRRRLHARNPVAAATPQ
jgi:hypothetical protein